MVCFPNNLKMRQQKFEKASSYKTFFKYDDLHVAHNSYYNSFKILLFLIGSNPPGYFIITNWHLPYLEDANNIEHTINLMV